MCIVFVWVRGDEPPDATPWERELAARYEYVVAANRDEFLARPATRLAPWPDAPGVVAGRDVTGGGTWVGVAPAETRWACLTNVREPPRPGDYKSRGALCAAYLRGDAGDAAAAAAAAAAAGAAHDGFNFIAGDADGCWYDGPRA